MTNKEKQRIWQIQQRKTLRLIPKYRKQLKQMFKAQGDQVLKGVAESVILDQIVPNALASIDKKLPEELLKRLYPEVGGEFAKDNNKRLTKIYKKVDPVLQESIWESEMVQYLRTYGATSIKTIIDTTDNLAREYLQRLILQGNAENLTIDEIKRLIEREFPKEWRHMATFRSDRIARTEIGAAASRGNFLGAKSTGLNLVKEWYAVLDSREREAHAAAHGQRVAMLSTFLVGGEQLNTPLDKSASPENVINCRCAVLYSAVE